MPNIIKVESNELVELTGNATTEDVLQGKTFYSNDDEQKLTGTMKNMSNGNYETSPNLGYGSESKGWIGLNIPETGKYNKYTYLWRYAKDLDIGVATPEQVLVGKSFSSQAGITIEGTMPDKNAQYYETSEINGLGSNGWIGLNIPETGKYTRGTYLYRYARDLDIGNAQANQVLSGLYFTSTYGVKLQGTYKPKIVMLGTVPINSTVTFDVKAKRPNDYHKYTKESFGIYTSSGGDYGDVHFYLSVTSYSYNPSNGILTMNCNKNVAYVNNFYCNIAIFLAE